MTTNEVANKLGISPAAVRLRCIQGRIEGAKRTSHGWWIPPNYTYTPGRNGRPPKQEAVE